MSCRKHIWQPLLPPPPAGADKAVHIAWFGHCLHGRDAYTVCTSCGCLGSVRRGYSRGGVHVTRPIANGEGEFADRLRAEAARWANIIGKENEIA